MADFPITEAPEFSGTMAQITNQDRGAPDTFNYSGSVVKTKI